MFIFSWFRDFLSSLGLWQKNAKILFLGLDNAGKTTLLHMLKEGRVSTHTPTLHPNKDEMTAANVRFKAFDLGGHETARKLWRDYCASSVDTVIFVVDAADRSRFPEAKSELDALLLLPELQRVPFVVLGNKIDQRAVAASEYEFRFALGLDETFGKGMYTSLPLDVRPVEVFMCSVKRGVGYKEGFKWMAQFL